MTNRIAVVLALALLAATAPARAQQQQRPAAPPTTPYGPPIGIVDAKKVAAAAVEAATKVSGAPDVIAIVGPGGHLIYLERMDNAQIGSVRVALDKARSAVFFRRSTKAFADLLAHGGMFVLGLRGAVPLAGGVPLVAGGRIIGAIGASGGTGDQNGQVAQAGAAVIK